MRVLDLFSGIGGFSLGLTRAGFRTTAFCEIEEYPRSILAKHWPGVHIFNDVKELHAADLPEPIDLICGGYPCQPFSCAGQRKGAADDRHLWPEIVRLIRELDATTGKPSWCIFENVAGHVSMGLDQVLSDLEDEGYACWPFIIPACAVNAPHRRDRVWIIANSDSVRCNVRRYQGQGVQREDETCHEINSGCQNVPNPGGAGSQKRIASAVPDNQGHFAGSDLARITSREWITLPGVRSRDDGLPQRVARLKALGNAVVPQIPEMIGRMILAQENI